MRRALGISCSIFVVGITDDRSQNQEIENAIMEVTKSKTIRRPEDLTALELSQLQHIVSSSSFAFGDPNVVKEVSDCFDRKNVDDGLIFYKELKRSSRNNSTMESFHYWLGYFGGNPIGYLLTSALNSNKQQQEGSSNCWQMIIENCDTDFVWHGDGEPSTQFIKEIKMAVYGNKYVDEDE